MTRLAFALALIVHSMNLHAESPLIVAHRGASAHAPENTLPAFQLAWELGADAIELDIHFTADRQLVCIHDSNTKRVASRKLSIRRSRLPQLQALDVGSWRGAAFADTRIPTLAEALATVPPGKQIFVELKSGTASVATLIETLDASALDPAQIRVISFNATALRALKQKAPLYGTSFLVGFETDAAGNLVPDLDTLLSQLRRSKADALGSSASPGIDAGLVHALNAAGYELHVWTVDSPAAARRFAKLGVASITTNDPAAIRVALESE